MKKTMCTLKSGSRFLRKRRKWPYSPYKTRWHESFSEQQALQSLRQQLTSLTQQQQHTNTPNNVLSTLKNSFNAYNCDPSPRFYHFALKTLLQTQHYVDQIPEILHHIELSEEFDTPEYMFVSLIKAFGKRDMINEAVDLFFRIPKFRCVPTVCSLNVLLSVLCRSEHGIRLVPQVLLRSQSMRIRLEESSVRILVDALCRIRKVRYAVEILRTMINDGCDVDFKVCSLVLSSLCEHKGARVVEVVGFFNEMTELRFCPSRVDYGNLIRFLAKAGVGRDALCMLERMKADGMRPDIVCYTMVLDGVVEGGEFDKAEKLFDELLLSGLVPDVYTYSVYIKGLCKQGKLEEGFRMFKDMSRLGCQPNTVTYNILLDGLCKVGELARAKEILREMGSNGVECNLQTQKILLNGLVAGGEIIEACNLLHEMLDKYVNFKCTRVDEIFCELCKRDMMSRALKLLDEMVGKNVAPGPKSWKALLLCSVSKVSRPETAIVELLRSV